LSGRAEWDAKVRGEQCPLCAPRAESNAEWDFVAKLAQASLYLAKNQTYTGQCILIFDPRHAARPDELSAREWAELSADLQAASNAVVRAVKADHVNVASLGNVVPHVHWHVIPRFFGDARWGAPIWTNDLAEMKVTKLEPSAQAELVAKLRAALAEGGALMAVETEERVALAGGDSMRAFLCLPDGAPPAGGWPGVVAIHDIMGFSPDIHRIARRFAAAGYATLAPALYDGAGAPPLCVARTVRDAGRGDGPAYARLDAARQFLATRSGVDATRIGVTGFCMGGGFALYWAARGGLQACAPFYGEVPESAERLRGVCPVVASFGELDRPFLPQAKRLGEHLAKLGVPHDVKIYAGVGHAFMNDHGGGLLSEIAKRTPMHAAYDEAAAEDAWRRMLAFFAEHL